MNWLPCTVMSARYYDTWSELWSVSLSSCNYYLLFLYLKTREEGEQEEDKEEEFYNGEEYSYEYEVGSLSEWLILEILGNSI